MNDEFWLHAHGYTLHDSAGHLVHMIGSALEPCAAVCGLQCAAIMEQHEQQHPHDAAGQPPAAAAVGRSLSSAQSMRKRATTPPSAAAVAATAEPAAQPAAGAETPAAPPRTPPNLPKYGGLLALLATKGGTQVLQVSTSSEPGDTAAGADVSAKLSRPASALSAAGGSTASQQVMAWLGAPVDPSGRAPPDRQQAAGGSHHGGAGQLVMDGHGTPEAAVGSTGGEEWHCTAGIGTVSKPAA